ncbi:MAG: glycosyltransferase [Candidatus Electryonea clarkiae]|nr:glycosyltransferase [Candidatus Electryonea clarkiae]MDP8285653.1 glycosyltransferase [Candidatus Electryonea clarkiae]
MNNDRMKIAVINLTRMGDLLMTGPMIDRLKTIYPGCEIHLFAVTSYKPIVEGMNVDKVVSFDFSHLTKLSIDAVKGNDNKSIADLVKEFKSEIGKFCKVKYDAIYNVSHTDVSLIFSHLLNGPVVGGLTLDREGYKVISGIWARYFFAGNLNRSLNPFHLVDVMVGTGNGLKDRFSHSQMKYTVTEDARKKVTEEEKTLLLTHETGPRIIIQCGASEEDKRWEAEKFGETGKVLFENTGAHILFVGTENEISHAEQATRVMSGGATILAGRTDLPTLAAWLESADLLITNDTGTMHLAQSVGTKSLVVTLGAALSDETGPYGDGNLIIEPRMACFPCNFQVECPHFNCHNDISPRTVVRLATDLLADTVPDNYTNQDIDSNCVVWKTGFDEDGWWRKVPITEIQPDRHIVIKEVFRELWKASIEKSLRPEGASPQQMNGFLASFYGELPKQLRERLLREDLRGVETLSNLALEGERLAEELVEASSGSNGKQNEIRNIGGMLFELDKRIDEAGITCDSWRPLLMMFHFGKENLAPGNLNQQAIETVVLYKELQKNANIAAFLLKNVLDQRIRKEIEVFDEEHPYLSELSMQIEDSNKASYSLNLERNHNINGNNRYSALSRPRMKGSSYHIIMPVNNYYVQEELSRAFLLLGHKVTRIPFEDNPDFIRDLLEASLSADLLLTINHLGFDQDGELASMLEGIGLPLVSWYVDRPGFILLDNSPVPTDRTFIFTWERSTIDELNDYGFQNVEYMPLATDLERFSPGVDGSEGRLRWVANSMLYPSAEWRQKAGINAERDPLFERSIMIQRSGRVEAMAAIEMAARAESVDISTWSRRKMLNYASAIALTATRELRKEVAEQCAASGLILYGDEGWRVLTPSIPLNGMVRYPDGLPAIYRGGVHINATSYQMPSGVNQRVFDIPAAGGILVTDDQEDLSELFESDQECITFSDPEEARDKAGYFLRNPEIGKNIMKQARKKIVKKHTYCHRAKQIINKVAEAIGSTVVMVEGDVR